MAYLHWNLLSPSPAPAPYPSSNGLSCQLENCSSDGLIPCLECVPYLFPPPPPPPPDGQNSFQSQIVPYLITLVCVLGIAFLILTTCTILLGHRWTKNRRNSRREAGSSDDGYLGEDDDQGSIDHPIWHITTIGLNQSVIDSITAFKYRKHHGLLIDGNSDCSVCLTEFQDGDDLRLLPKCSHAFHLCCIDTWLRSHKNCPICRAPVVNDVVSAVGEGTNYAVGESNTSDSDSIDGGGSRSQGLEDDHIHMWSSDHRGGRRSGSLRGESSRQIREKGDYIGILPIEGTVILDEILKRRARSTAHSSDFGVVPIDALTITDDILKKQRGQLRAHSDLGCNHHRSWTKEDVAPISRSLSFDFSINVGSLKDEGTSSSSSKQGKGIDDVEKDTGAGEQQLLVHDDGNGSNGSNMSVSGSMKNHSIGRLLPVSMKRSISSSSGKFFSSFRRSKSQATVLPL